MDKWEKFKQDIQVFSAEERRAIVGIVDAVENQGSVSEAVTALAQARRRTMKRRESDARTDHARRTLIGARLPREEVQQYREAAREKHLSLYSWVREALRKAERDQKEQRANRERSWDCYR